MIRLPAFLPDLTLWYTRNLERGSLPAAWRLWSLQDICRDLGVGAWLVQKPWRIEYDGVNHTEEQDASGRVRRWETSGGVLHARWILGPDGDWWQSEYPVKTVEDLPLVAEVVRARRYVVDPTQTKAGIAESGSGGDDLYPVIELPMRPWSELLHSYIGWTEGLMIAFDESERLGEFSETLEDKYGLLLKELAEFPQAIFLSPDNLDGNFISPGIFEEHLSAGYTRTAEFLHSRNKSLTVHLGGYSGSLLAPLADCGVDCVEGVCGPPQGDVSIPEARSLCGNRLTLWGGLAQDWLLPSCTDADFRAACDSALADVRADNQAALSVAGRHSEKRAVLGIADRVPADAVIERLRYMAG
jgi:hypothetical protein